VWLLSFGNDVDYRDGDDDGIVVLTETMSSLLCPRQSSNYGIDLRSLAITEKKAWHVFVDCVVCVPDCLGVS